jgi:hypothetical protein
MGRVLSFFQVQHFCFSTINKRVLGCTQLKFATAWQMRGILAGMRTVRLIRATNYKKIPTIKTAKPQSQNEIMA